MSSSHAFTWPPSLRVHLVEKAGLCISIWDVLECLEKRHCLPSLSSNHVISDDNLYPLYQWLQLPTCPVPSQWVTPKIQREFSAWWVALKQGLSFSALLSFLVIGPFSRITTTFKRIQWDCSSSRDPAPAPQYKLLWWQIPVSTPCW